LSIRNRLISSSFAVVGRLYCRALPKSWLSLVRASRELPGVVFHSRSKLANTKSLFLTIGAPTLNPSVLFRISLSDSLPPSYLSPWSWSLLE